MASGQERDPNPEQPNCPQLPDYLIEQINEIDSLAIMTDPTIRVTNRLPHEEDVLKYISSPDEPEIASSRFDRIDKLLLTVGGVSIFLSYEMENLTDGKNDMIAVFASIGYSLLTGFFYKRWFGTGGYGGRR